jgi:ring-1,2-phenylacetyl-CoA epoxidase subunit PaaD
MVTPEQRAIAAAAARGEDAARMPIEPLPLAAAWQALGTVMDPEVPVISIVELGIVRSIAFDRDVLVVKVTPTYSGCPATDVIVASIRDVLGELGLRDVRVETQLAPAWTTDWIAPEAKRRLSNYGIAPPHLAAPRIDVTGISPLRRARVAVPCPRCGSPRTTLTAQFGSTACKALYRCDDCREPFDYFKPH